MVDQFTSGSEAPDITTTDFGKMDDAALKAMLAAELGISANELKSTPLSDEDKEAGAKLNASGAQDKQIQTSGKYKDVSIVIIDDDADVADTLMKILNSLGVENVTIFDSTQEARAYIKSFGISDDDSHVTRFRNKCRNLAYGEEITVKNLIADKLVIFQDYDCPTKGSGIKFLKALDIIIPGHNIAQIIYSGNHDLPNETAWNGLGADAEFMTKPFTLGQVEGALDSALAKAEEKSHGLEVSCLL